MMDAAKVVSYISDWLSSYLKNSGMKGFVVGISGGVDSAVTSTLCAHTGFPTFCLELPIFQERRQLLASCRQIEYLMNAYSNCKSQLLDLSSSFEHMLSVVSDQVGMMPLASANLRSRLRMCVLYHYASVHKALVVGTGNKIEDFGVGFFTKYGDGGVDISPIADLYKSEVFALSRYLGLPDLIQEAVPTDGLFEGSPTDEEQIGASYDELEWAMKHSQIVDEDHLTNREKEVLNLYRLRQRLNRHKMNPPPVCIIPSDFRD